MFDASGSCSVLTDSFSKIDVQGLSQNISNLGTSLPALANLDNLSSVFPPSLNAFANGFGASLQGKADKLVEQIVPLANSIMTDANLNSAVNDALNGLTGNIVESLEAELDEFQEKFEGTAKGQNSQPEKEPGGPGITIH